MLTDPRAIAIIADAQQKGVRNPARSRKHFTNILDDFFPGVALDGACVLDLGPGQWDLGVVVRERGGDVFGIDKDPAVRALGEYMGFDCLEADLRRPEMFRQLDRRFDGVFCKFSINAFWYGAAQREFVESLMTALKPNAWGWIAPWNGRRDATGVRGVLNAQTRAFRDAGFRAFDLVEGLTARYGVHGDVANSPLFTRNLSVPDAVLGQEVGGHRG